MVHRLEELFRWRARPTVSRVLRVAVDLAVLIGAFAFAYHLRFDFAVPAAYRREAVIELGYVAFLQLAALRLTGVYRFVWRYIGLAEIRAFINAAILATAPIVAIRLAPVSVLPRVPLSVIIMDAFLAFSGVLALRVLRRVIYEASERRTHTCRDQAGVARVLLIGAGQAGMMAAREITRRADAGLRIVGFVDDDAEKAGSSIHGIRVLGSTCDLRRLVTELAVDHVILTIAQAPRENIRRIVSLCESIPVKIRVIPGLYEILGGRVEISRIRNIEIEDLLGRDPVHLDDAGIAGLVGGKTVLVTGAGGSIGSELARQVARFAPARLLLVERAEFALFEIEQELARSHPALQLDPLVADVGDEARMRAIFERHRPHVVIHAAAHKHVPMMELQPSEAIKNNVLPTRLLGHLAGVFRSDAFVLISTDKAVNPTSVMGASKRVAELVIQDLSRLHRQTRFVGVRFGNVMGSAGSVIPIFRRQIAAGGPVTVTHPAMTRYFMTIPEAAQLVLEAATIGEGGEIFVLDMGEPVKIVDLAAQMIRLSGLRPNEDIEIVFSGIRPGEKLYEELDRLGETLSKTKHPKIFNGNLTPYESTTLAQFVGRLEQAARRGAHDEVRVVLSEMLPESRLTLSRAKHEELAAAFVVVEAPKLHLRKSGAMAAVPELHPALVPPVGTQAAS